MELSNLLQLNKAVRIDTIARQTGSTSGRKHKKLSPQDVQWLKDNGESYTVAEIREHLGSAADTIRKRMKSLNLKPKAVRGDKHAI